MEFATADGRLRSEVYQVERSRRLTAAAQIARAVGQGGRGGRNLVRIFDARVQALDAEWRKDLREQLSFRRQVVDRLPMLASPEMIGAWGKVRARAVALACAGEEPRAAYAAAARYVRGFGLVPPIPHELRPNIRKIPKRPLTFLGAVLRLSSERWWRRAGRQQVALATEMHERNAGKVRHGEGLYCSDWSFRNVSAYRRRARELIEAMVAVNELGHERPLAQLVDATTANPALRCTELMTYIRGIEDYGRKHGYRAIFAVWTLASQWHAYHKESGSRNHKFNHKSPHEAAQFLCKLWARCRAWLHRRGIKIFGLRTVEPNHDGTPHWNLLLWAKPDDLPRLREALARYALSQDGTEPGAATRRLVIEYIDDRAGGATAYIAKYIAKGVDGRQTEITHAQDENGNAFLTSQNPKTAAERVGAWLATWRVRQFQFVGQVHIGIYRELRRLGSQAVACESIEQVRVLADAHRVGDFLQSMGGPTAPRGAAPIRLWKQLHLDFQPLTQYREGAAPAVLGVHLQNAGGGESINFVNTRPHTWRLEFRAEGRALVERAGESPWTRVNNCTRIGGVSSDHEFGGGSQQRIAAHLH